MARKKMGEILLETQLITKEQLEQALVRQQRSKKPLGKILEDMDIILEEDIAKALSKQFGFPFVKQIARFNFLKDVLSKIDVETALANNVFPLKIKDNTLYLAMANPLNMGLQNELAFKLGLRISPCVATTKEIRFGIKKHYMAKTATPPKDQTWELLVVDSQEAALGATEAALQKEGYSVHKARNGAEGLKRIAQARPSLIITEIVMPRMDGIEMFKKLQESSDTAEIPVIAFTGKSTAEDEFRLLDMGFFDFVAKPLNQLRLQARVHRAIRWHNLNRN